MTVGLGSAIVCLLLAGLGYGAVFVVERARANPTGRRLTNQTTGADDLYELELDGEEDYAPADDATSPLAAEAEYGWPMENAELARTEAR
jgi:hypothetical protein